MSKYYSLWPTLLVGLNVWAEAILLIIEEGNTIHIDIPDTTDVRCGVHWIASKLDIDEREAQGVMREKRWGG